MVLLLLSSREWCTLSCQNLSPPAMNHGSCVMVVMILLSHFTVNDWSVTFGHHPEAIDTKPAKRGLITGKAIDFLLLNASSILRRSLLSGWSVWLPMTEDTFIIVDHHHHHHRVRYHHRDAGVSCCADQRTITTALPCLTADQVRHLKERHHVYMLSSGRISVAGLTGSNVAYVADAMHDAIISCPSGRQVTVRPIFVPPCLPAFASSLSSAMCFRLPLVKSQTECVSVWLTWSVGRAVF